MNGRYYKLINLYIIIKMEKELLQQFRDQVKTIDLEIVYLLSRRFENTKQIYLLWWCAEDFLLRDKRRARGDPESLL